MIWRGGRWVRGVSRFLNIAAVALLVFNALRVANFASASAAAATANPSSPAVVLQEPSVKPDIYYIILDRYANADTLREIYHFDNEPFLQRAGGARLQRGAPRLGELLQDRALRLHLAEHALHRPGAAGRRHEPAG